MLSTNSIEKHTKDFWKYASQTKGVHQIEDAFMDWAKGANIDLNTFQVVFASVTYDVESSFETRSAKMPKKEFLQQLMQKLFQQSQDQQSLTNFYNEYLFGKKEEEEDLFNDSLMDESSEMPGMNEMGGTPEAGIGMGDPSMDKPMPTTPVEGVGVDPNNLNMPNENNQSEEPDLASSMNELINF